ncbi:MAG: hypothetical protein LBD34_01750 [Puniceicoccales bacterium]|jgi:hypothetical protein|nr:hypothetical protein [Puniceicoccales bacterium]
MEMLSNVHSGQQALDQIPATILDLPKPDPDIFGRRKVRCVSPLANIPSIIAQMPNGSLRTVEFRTLARDKEAIRLLFQEVGLSPAQLRQKIDTSGDPRVRDSRIRKLNRLAPIYAGGGYFDLHLIYGLLTIYPVILGRILVKLGR